MKLLYLMVEVYDHLKFRIERKISIVSICYKREGIILNKMNYCKIVIQLFNSSKGEIKIGFKRCRNWQARFYTAINVN